ncbi:MAG TPA: nickel-responsive transcriptional regulator NikR, partial [Firmicutes bacterium]|nr:nickel-responsive transcriptional regulator NikR [Bacillota bacterium]
MESELQRIGVSIEENLLDQFDRLIGSKGYTNRSEAIRDLIREYLVEDEWQTGEGDAVGTITLVY